MCSKNIFEGHTSNEKPRIISKTFARRMTDKGTKVKESDQTSLLINHY